MEMENLSNDYTVSLRRCNYKWFKLSDLTRVFKNPTAKNEPFSLLSYTKNTTNEIHVQNVQNQNYPHFHTVCLFQTNKTIKSKYYLITNESNYLRLTQQKCPIRQILVMTLPIRLNGRKNYNYQKNIYHFPYLKVNNRQKFNSTNTFENPSKYH